MTNNPAGRKPGTKNKLRKPLVDEIFAISEKLASEGKGLEDCAKQDPAWFFVNFLKNLIPKNIEVTGTGGGPIASKIEIVFINPKDTGRVPDKA